MVDVLCMVVVTSHGREMSSESVMVVVVVVVVVVGVLQRDNVSLSYFHNNIVLFLTFILQSWVCDFDPEL